tara:strand:+ start:656 stop:853 length:198 start_codon:yes stop_codon:yes gene_type:complete
MDNKKGNSKMDLTDSIIKYENGEMEEEKIIIFFQELINSGLCWKLQGHYGRMAAHLIEEGLCNER